ncbi:hypothetical protein ACFYZJ_37710 [Streptomyces sp. NPDC001848]|uniref:hypothetical protein n=1 Tax=Streptomyces sp. NPDC001848 TaxID=3364618 RepID=UPI00368B040E
MSMSDEQFAEQRRRLVQELHRPPNQLTEAKKPTNRVDAPDGALPSPEGDGEPKLWQLGPQELQARVTAALWPGDIGDNSAHAWVPRPPVTLDQYLRDGI